MHPWKGEQELITTNVPECRDCQTKFTGRKKKPRRPMCVKETAQSRCCIVLCCCFGAGGAALHPVWHAQGMRFSPPPHSAEIQHAEMTGTTQTKPHHNSGMRKPTQSVQSSAFPVFLLLLCGRRAYCWCVLYWACAYRPASRLSLPPCPSLSVLPLSSPPLSLSSSYISFRIASMHKEGETSH